MIEIDKLLTTSTIFLRDLKQKHTKKHFSPSFENKRLQIL